MSFGRLLAAGKSWVGGDGIGRYRMQKHIRLPKFISPQNPFKSTVVGDGQSSPATALASHEAATDAACFGVGRIGIGTRCAGWGSRAAKFCLDHNPFSPLRSAKPMAIPRFGKPGVQGELSLDKVQVIRGDLAHADLEVVQLSSGGNRAGSPVWKNLAARIFGTADR